jgi:hypothetical protein
MRMRIFAFLLACASHALATGYIVGITQINVDPGTGNIVVQGNTHYFLDSGTEYLYANVTTQVAGWPSVYAEDNCSVGCAYAAAYGQVFQLGLQYTGISSHYGQGVDGEGQFSQAFVQSSDSYLVPGAPYIQLQTLNAQNPHAVGWGYGVVGPPAFTYTFQLGGAYIVSNGPTFTTDQSSYPQGASSATMTAYSYGIAINTPPCSVTNSAGPAVNQSSTGLRWDGFTDGQNGVPEVIVARFAWPRIGDHVLLAES